MPSLAKSIRRCTICAQDIRSSGRNIRRAYYSSYADSQLSAQKDNVDDIAIVGGGITGLGCAYFAAKKNPRSRITIYEQSPRFGGWLQTSRHRVPGDGGTVLFEAGPRTLRPKGNGRLTISMIQDLGLAEHTITSSKSSLAATNRYIYYPDHLVRLPAPPAPFWARDLMHTVLNEEAFEGALWALFEPMRPPRPPTSEDESIGSFLSRRLSRNLVDRVVSAVFHGIYAGDVWQLSARSLLKRPYQFERDYGSILVGALRAGRQRSQPLSSMEASFRQYLQDSEILPDFAKSCRDSSVFTFRDGIGQLTTALIENLERNPNVHFASGTSIKAIKTTGNGIGLETLQKGKDSPQSLSHNKVIWTAAHNTLRSLSKSNSNAPPSLSKMDSETVMTVNLYYKTPDLHPPGFGYLIPLATPFQQNPENALGVVFDDSYSFGPAEHDAGDQPVHDTVSGRGTKLTVIIGGHYWSDWTSFPSEAEGMTMAKEVVKRHLGIQEEPLVQQATLQADCIPRYAVGHHDRVAETHRWLMDRFGGKVKVAGSWVDGVGVNDCLRSAWNAVYNLDDVRSTSLNHVVDDE